ncbi:2-dehydro-3-deoxygalactonokinase [Halovulum sp. GXIMD14793]
MTEVSDKTAWIAVDWGTTNLRVWVLNDTDQVVARAETDQGMAGLDREGFEPALLNLIDPFLAQDRVTPVLCCGMVGSRQGWAEARYVTAPCTPPGGREATQVSTNDSRISVSILPGVKQTNPPDVMRGEETQIAGFLRDVPDFDGVLCLPGTHTKWVQISAGEIVSFRTCMTGELFALLSENSVLRHSVAGEAIDTAAFDDAVAEALTRPEALSAHLFRLRAASLIAEMPAVEARARLSGSLIGAELASTRPYWLGQNIALLGAARLAELYRSALVAQGAECMLADITEMTLRGLSAARSSIKDPT